MADRAALRSQDRGQRERYDTGQLRRSGHTVQVAPRRVSRAAIFYRARARLQFSQEGDFRSPNFSVRASLNVEPGNFFNRVF